MRKSEFKINFNIRKNKFINSDFINKLRMFLLSDIYMASLGALMLIFIFFNLHPDEGKGGVRTNTLNIKEILRNSSLRSGSQTTLSQPILQASCKWNATQNNRNPKNRKSKTNSKSKEIKLTQPQKCMRHDSG